jgi:hypothetical protein
MRGTAVLLTAFCTDLMTDYSVMMAGLMERHLVSTVLLPHLVLLLVGTELLPHVTLLLASPEMLLQWR